MRDANANSTAQLLCKSFLAEDGESLEITIRLT